MFPSSRNYDKHYPTSKLFILLKGEAHISGLLSVRLHHVACGILVPQPGIEPVPLAMKAWSSNHWTAREFPSLTLWVKRHLYNILLLDLSTAPTFWNPSLHKGFIFSWPSLLFSQSYLPHHSECCASQHVSQSRVTWFVVFVYLHPLEYKHQEASGFVLCSLESSMLDTKLTYNKYKNENTVE